MEVKTINIIGAGSLGSFTTQILVKMLPTIQCDINIWDFDNVEEHNVNNQLYSLKDVNKPKVESLSKIITSLGGPKINTVNLEFEEKHDLRGLIIVAVDSMAARKKVLNMARFNWGIDYLIEARMGGHLAKIFALDPKNQEAIRLYEPNFYSDREADNPICATNETVPSLWITAASIANLVLNYHSSTILIDKFIETTIDLKQYPLVNSKSYALI